MFKFRLLLLISVMAIAGCAKMGYEDSTGRHYYKGNDGRVYYKDNTGHYVYFEDIRSSSSGTSQITASDTLSKRVMADLQSNAELKKQNIKVSSNDGQVELSGYVNTNNDRLEAINITRKVPGVRLVIDKLAVKLFSFT